MSRDYKEGISHSRADASANTYFSICARIICVVPAEGKPPNHALGFAYIIRMALQSL